MSKKFMLLTFFIIFYTLIDAQYAGWMVGIWKATTETTTSSESITNFIKINDIIGESFTGTKTREINDGSSTKITIAISGAFRARGLYIQNGDVLHKEPENGKSYDCSACTEVNKMIIKRDSLILVDSISGCDNGCDAVTFYFRLLSEYDDETQRYLVDRFGRPSDIIGFHPYQPKEGKTVDSIDNNESPKNKVVAVTMTPDPSAEAIKNAAKQHQDSLDNIARIKLQQKHDAAQIAQQRKREKTVTDSLNLLQTKQKQLIKDSLYNVAKQEKIRKLTEDSLRVAEVKKRQLQISDSINLVHQKKQEQETADSLNLVKQKAQQRINDSLQNVAAINQQKQLEADSISKLQARQKQQQITDSLAALRKQQYDDSLQKAALAKAASPPNTDSTSSAGNKELTSRSSVLLGSYHITTPDILIELFDNGEIDGDRVSVYHNKEIVISNQMLNTKPITLNIHADLNNREHEFVLVAENLGSIPPNSALMRITAGKQVYKLSVNTDMKTNARIVFYYDGN